MTQKETPASQLFGLPMSRRKALKLAATALTTVVVTAFGAVTVIAKENPTPKEKIMTQKAYVYTELQISTPFENVPWQRINKDIKKQPGFINKTWLAGVGNNSAGGFYVFDSIENAQKFVTDYFPAEAREFGVAQTTRVFEANATEEASRDMNSMHWDGKINGKPGAFVYTEVQLRAVPFNEAAPWRKLNPVLKKQPGLMAKTLVRGTTELQW